MPEAEPDVNPRQKAVLGLLFLVTAAVILFPPWVEVLRDDQQERHVVFLGRARNSWNLALEDGPA